MREYQTDVLVVGAGLAGLRAAVRGIREGLKTLIAYQGAGASRHVLAFNAIIPGESADSEQAFIDDMLRSGGGINNLPLVKRFVKLSGELLYSLESVGFKPDRDEQGRYLRRHLGGSSHPRSFYSSDSTGGDILKTLWEYLRTNGAEELPSTRILLPVLGNDEILGAIGFDTSSGEEVLIQAKSIVLAGGGLGALFAGSTYPPDVDGSCAAFALLAGAELTDMEFVQFEPTVCFTHEKINRMEMPTAMLGDGAMLRNSSGERFMLRYGYQKEAGIEKALMAKCIYREIQEGRGSPSGGVYFDGRTIPTDLLKRYELRLRRLQEAGIDLTKEMVEVKPVAHSHMGGIRTDEHCAACLPGLFAAGECAGGLHGASRIAGNSGAEALVLGDLAGMSAAMYARKKAWLPAEALKKAASDSVDKANLFTEKIRCIPEDFSAQMSALLAKGCEIMRNAQTMNEALAEMQKIKDTCLHKAGSPPSLMRKIEAAGQLLVAQCVLSAALMRQESRGAHCRSDFPDEQSDWKVNIVHNFEKSELHCRCDNREQQYI